MSQMIFRHALVALLVVTIGGTASLARPGESLKPGKLSKQEQAALQPGLTLRFYSKDAPDAPLDARRVRLAALHVPEGTPPSPFLEVGPFTAKLTGYLTTALKSEFSFRLTCKGSATLIINGKEVLKAENETKNTSEPILLAKGFNRIEFSFASPVKGDATVRVGWSGENFTTEPLPPDLLSSRGDQADLLRGQERREGRLLYATLGCARCHELPGKIKEADIAMPEMRQRAPSLDGAGRRWHTSWMSRWILDPRSLRPEARMPQVLHGETAPQQATDLAAYLASLQNGPELQASPATAELVAQGEKHFEQIGCIACHTLEVADERGRMSLSYVRAKYQPGALEAFLKAPHQHYSWIRMPDFRLDAKEVPALAAFLLDRAKDLEPAAKKGEASRGAKLFGEVGCAHCHAIKPGEPAIAKLRASPAGDTLTKGCLAELSKPAPHFALTKAQRAALMAFLRSDGFSLRRETPAEFSLRQVKELQCQSCHRRDGMNSRWNEYLADEGLMHEYLPSLSWVGEKLKPAWAAKLLAGEHDHRARPWLKARMPGFPARADMLALGLSHEHGFAAGEDDRPAPDAKLAALGAKLIEQQGGFNCVMCHAVGKRPSVAPFEAPGINLLDAALRLRHHYYPRWMIDPPHVDITTRMPKFSQDGKTTPLRDVLDGDAFRQYDAVWHFIQSLPGKAGKQ